MNNRRKWMDASIHITLNLAIWFTFLMCVFYSLCCVFFLFISFLLCWISSSFDRSFSIVKELNDRPLKYRPESIFHVNTSTDNKRKRKRLRRIERRKKNDYKLYKTHFVIVDWRTLSLKTAEMHDISWAEYVCVCLYSMNAAIWLNGWGRQSANNVMTNSQ